MTASAMKFLDRASMTFVLILGCTPMLAIAAANATF